MIDFSNISVYTNEAVYYNIYAVSSYDQNDDITLSEENCVADNVSRFDFAMGFAAALLSYSFVSDVFITEVHDYYNPWGESEDTGSYERIIWQGSVTPGKSEEDVELTTSGVIEDSLPN